MVELLLTFSLTVNLSCSQCYIYCNGIAGGACYFNRILRMDLRKSTEPLLFSVLHRKVYILSNICIQRSFIFNCTTVKDLEFLKIVHLIFSWIVYRSNHASESLQKREFIELGEMELKIYKSLGALKWKDMKNLFFDLKTTF